MTRRKLLVLLGAGAVLLALMLGLGFGRSQRSDRPGSVDRQAPAPAEPERGDELRSPDSPPPNPRDRAAKPEARGEPEPLRRALQLRYGTSPSSEPAGADPAKPIVPPSSWTSLPEEYVAGILREQLIPVAQSCYEDLAGKGTNGALTLSVAVIGDSEVGGVIDRIDVKDADDAIDAELSECVRQSAYAMEFDPPEEGQGVQEFDFTLRFSDDE